MVCVATDSVIDQVAMLLSQMATYWFVIGWWDIQKVQKSEV